MSRVLAAIRVRSGRVRLVFESPQEYKKTVEMTTKQIKAKEDAAVAAQEQKDQLLAELESDEKVGLRDRPNLIVLGRKKGAHSYSILSCVSQKLKKGKFFGLF